MHVTHQDIQKVVDDAQRAKSAAKNLREKAEEVVGQVVQTTEVGLAAFGCGLVKGRYGDVRIVGVPFDMLGALLFHGAGFLGVAGKHSSHAHGFGNGFIASYAIELGQKVGTSMREKAGLPPVTASTSGIESGATNLISMQQHAPHGRFVSHQAAARQPYTQDELDAMAVHQRAAA